MNITVNNKITKTVVVDKTQKIIVNLKTKRIIKVYVKT